jgi:hypothetical protein
LPGLFVPENPNKKGRTPPALISWKPFALFLQVHFQYRFGPVCCLFSTAGRTFSPAGSGFGCSQSIGAGLLGGLRLILRGLTQLSALFAIVSRAGTARDEGAGQSNHKHNRKRFLHSFPPLFCRLIQAGQLGRQRLQDNASKNIFKGSVFPNITLKYDLYNNGNNMRLVTG